MHKTKEIVKAEINEIVARPLTVSAVGVLGELIDIYKDIEYIEYMHCKEAHMEWEEHESERTDHENAESLSDEAIKKISDSLVAYKKAKGEYSKRSDAVTKRNMINTLQEVMDSYNYAIHGTWDRTDTEEERAIIKDYVSKRFLA